MIQYSLPKIANSACALIAVTLALVLGASGLSFETKLAPIVILVADAETRRPINMATVKNTNESIVSWGVNEVDPQRKEFNEAAKKERGSNDMGMLVLFCAAKPEKSADGKHIETRITATLDCSAKDYESKKIDINIQPHSNEKLDTECSPIVKIYLSRKK
jgi:hypothetical protein